MNDPAAPQFETLLKLIAASAPQPWYPVEFARAMGIDRDRVDGPLDAMRLAGLIELTPWVSGRGQGYEITDHGEDVLNSGRQLARLRAGQLPERGAAAPADDPDPAIRGTTFGRGEEIRRSLIRESKPRVTQVLIGLNLLVFAAGVVIMLTGNRDFAILLGWGDERVPELTGAVSGPALLRGEWWRLLTSCFVHHGIVHLGFNMYSIWGVGQIAERIWGRWRYLAIYLLAGVGGSCVAMLEPRGVLAGASGALCGIFASLPVWLMLNRSHLPSAFVREWMNQLTSNAVLIVIMSLLPGVSWRAHLGGAIAGAVVAALLNAHRYSSALVRWPALLLVPVVPVLCVGLVVQAKTSNPRWARLAKHLQAVKAETEDEDYQRVVGSVIAKKRKQANDGMNLAYHIVVNKLPAEPNMARDARDALQTAMTAVREGRAAIQAAPAFESQRLTNLGLIADDAFLKQMDVLESIERRLQNPAAWQDEDEEAFKKAVDAMNKRWSEYADLWNSKA